MSREPPKACSICGDVAPKSERRFLVHGRTRRVFCSNDCLRVGVRELRVQQRKALRRRMLFALVSSLALTGALYVRHLARLPLHHEGRLSVPLRDTPAPEPTFGPAWPPTDEEWLAQLTRSNWIYPLPGPARRHPAIATQIPPPALNASVRPRCRTPAHCGVHLGGEIWGEHVYAAHDGVIDRLQRSSDDVPGGVYVRISHWGGLVFTQYFHLAAIPTRLTVGAHVSAGDVIGLVGDTGGDESGAHLHFTLSVRPSSTLPEIYWDPEPLMMSWPLETPARGSVTGMTSIEGPGERVAGTPSVLRSIRSAAR